jgi:ATP-dependent DNA ligase
MTEIEGRIMLSKQTLIKKADELQKLMMDAIKEGLEGLVLKGIKVIFKRIQPIEVCQLRHV